LLFFSKIRGVSLNKDKLTPFKYST